MIDSALYVFDHTHNLKQFMQYCTGKSFGKVFLCPLTTRQEATALIVKQLSLLKDCQIVVLPYLEHFNKRAFSERDNFIRFISEFAEQPRFRGMNFKEYFRYPQSSFSLWWLSSISEKNPLTSDAYHNLIKLLTILRLIKECKCRQVLLALESAELSQSIKDNARESGYIYEDFKRYRIRPQIISLLINVLKAMKCYLYSIYKLFIIKVNLKGLAFRETALRNAQYIAVTYFPLVDKESLKQKRFVNKYYGLLQTALENRYKDKFIWLAMTPGINGFSFRDSIRLGRQVNTWNYPMYFLEEWIGLKDLVLIMVWYIYFTMKCIINMPELPKRFKYLEGRINIWRIFEEDWFSSFAGNTLISGIFHVRAFKNISSRLKCAVVLTYLAENHAWERALNFTFHNKNRLKVIGIVHTTLPLLFLPLFDFRDGFTPDYLACCGRIPLKLLQQAGWKGRKTLLWPALRYQHLKRYLQKEIPWESRQNKILVALSSSAKESKELLSYIHQAFSGQKDYQVIIKGHYTLTLRSLVRKLNLDFNKDTFIFSNGSLDRLLLSVKAMVMVGSSAALEGIALGCPVIIPRLSSVVDMNPLSGVSDLPIYAASPKELQTRVDEILTGKESPILYEKCKDFIENYFEFADSKNKLIEKVESCFVTAAETL